MSCNDNRSERNRVQCSAADQATIDVGACKKLGGIRWFARAAVQDARGAGQFVAVQLADYAADERVHFLGLHSGCCNAGANGPDGLVGDVDARHVSGGEVGGGRRNLSLHPVVVRA